MQEIRSEFGTYRLESVLGEGGMGKVYKGSRVGAEGFQKPVAVKFLHREMLEQRQAAESLISEAKVVSLLNHPNIVEVYELGEHDNSLFMVMELVDGYTLDDLLEINQGPILHNIAASLILEVANALQCIQKVELQDKELTIIHSDISLQNIMINSKTEISKLNDFGFARITQKGKSLPVREPIIGNPYFISPEHIRGQWIDARSDIFSLGIVFYELLFANRDYSWDLSTLTSLARQGASVDLGLLSQLPVPLEKVLRKMLEPNPNERYQTATELIKALETLGEELEGYQKIKSERREFFKRIKLLSQGDNQGSLVKEGAVKSTGIGALQVDPSLLNALTNKEEAHQNKRKKTKSMVIQQQFVRPASQAVNQSGLNCSRPVENKSSRSGAVLPVSQKSKKIPLVSTHLTTPAKKSNNRGLFALCGVLILVAAALIFWPVQNKDRESVGSFENPTPQPTVAASPIPQPPQAVTPAPTEIPTEDVVEVPPSTPIPEPTPTPTPTEVAVVRPGTLRFNVTPWGKVKIQPLTRGLGGTKKLSVSPSRSNLTRLAPGKYKVTISHPGFPNSTRRVTVRISSGRSQTLSHSF